MFRMLQATCIAIACVSAPAFAAEVGSGTLTLSSMDLSFGGGPIVGTNATNTVGPDCIDPVLPCDQYALRADLPEDLTDFFPTALIRITLGPTQSLSGADDYDLRLIDGNGNVLGESTSETANEAVSTIAFGGERDYTVEVIHWLVLGGSYEANIELSLGQPSTDKTDEEIAAWFAENGADQAAEARAIEACTAPGLTLLEDPAGDGGVLITGAAFDFLDITDVSIFQQGTPNSEDDPLLIGFRIKVASLASGPIPNTTYFTSFITGFGAIPRGARMEVDTQGSVNFSSYVVGLDNDGERLGQFAEDGSVRPAAPGSFFDPSGEIVILVPAADIGILAAGDEIRDFNASSILFAGTPPIDLVGSVGVSFQGDAVPDDLASRQGRYVIQSEEECLADDDAATSRSLAPLSGGGALGSATLALILLGLGLRRRLPR